MKDDLEKKANYLKYLKITRSFVNPCNCKQKGSELPLEVHAYCMTARIILNQRIYCEKCNTQYNLFIKQEKLCSGKLLQLFFKYLLFMAILSLFAAAFLIQDGYMKTQHAQENPEEARKAYQLQLENKESSWLSFGQVPDYSQNFDIVKSVRWTDMIHIIIILVILMSWCFYFQFNRAMQTRKKLIYVEVKDKDKKISRIISKENLNTVIETNTRKKNNNQLFDKFWYQTREKKSQS